MRILCEGFDPRLRCRQQHGAGEYFDRDLSVSDSYRSGNGALIATLIFRPPGNAVVNETKYSNSTSIYVVSNSFDRSVTYCLPVFAICVGQTLSSALVGRV